MIWILNRPPKIRRLLAIAILLVVTATIVFLAAFGIEHLVQKTNHINEQRVLLGRLGQIIEKMPNDQQLQSFQSESSNAVDFLSGPSETVIRANLQQRFNQMAMGQKVNVISVGNAPDFDKNGITYVGLQANVSGTMEGLHHTLLAVESAKPLLFVTNLTVRSTGGVSNQPPNSDPVLIAQLRLYGALKPLQVEDGQAKR